MGGVTEATPSLETAYPNDVYILRTPKATGGIVHYEVRVYAPEVLAVDRLLPMNAVAIVVSDSKGTQLLSTTLVISGPKHIPPSKEEFCSFYFSVHDSLEATTAINIGRHTGIREYFTNTVCP